MSRESSESRVLRIKGLVQGVGFRWHLASQAEQRGLQGWVRNRRDGSVEALVWGRAEDVAGLIVWARMGPPAARVDQVLVEHTEERPEGFCRLSDA